MAIIDVAIIAFFLVGPYFGGGRTYLIIDYAIAVIIAFELGARALIASSLRRWLTRPMTWVDVAILATLLFPATLSNFAFLRAFRIWSLGQSKVFTLLIKRAGYGEWEDVVRACINFLTFLFLVTGFVYTAFFYHRGGDRGICRRALFHRRHDHHHRLRRYHAAGHARQADLDRDDDLRHLAVRAPRAGDRAAAQGRLSLPAMRPAAARC